MPIYILVHVVNLNISVAEIPYVTEMTKHVPLVLLIADNVKLKKRQMEKLVHGTQTVSQIGVGLREYAALTEKIVV